MVWLCTQTTEGKRYDKQPFRPGVADGIEQHIGKDNKPGWSEGSWPGVRVRVEYEWRP
jgi:hypothetical protein